MKILLGITGSVAATLTPKMVKALIEAGHEVKIVTTERGQFFFDQEDVPLPIMSDKDEWPEDGYHKGEPVLHIDLGDWADALLIAPLTADTLADMAAGKADKFLTSTILAWPRDKKIYLAPAMNTRMWENPLTQKNLKAVKEIYSTTVVPPIEGHLACDTIGIGAMARIESIVSAII